MRTRRCLRRVSGSLRVSSTFCVDFRTSPCGFLENIPPGPGLAPAPRSRGEQRPPDPPAPRQRRLLLPPTEMRRGAARSQLAAGPGGAEPGLPLPLSPLSSLCFTTAVRCDPRRPYGNRTVTSRPARPCAPPRRGALGSASLPPARPWGRALAEPAVPLPGAGAG
uniref:Uncharacterized protein n=1 Tax=Melopsittacus undulatus TaxID=13146 RepID=A0A8V5G1J9_MELUD